MMTHLGARCDRSTSAPPTLAGTARDSRLLRQQAGPFQPENHWVSETPAYKIRITVERRQGHPLLRVPLRRREDRQGGLGRGGRPERAEDRRQVADHELCCGAGDARRPEPPMTEIGRPGWRTARQRADALARADNPLVRAVARVPVRVRTKLLAAFAAIAVLLVAVAAPRPAGARPVERPRRVARDAAAAGRDVPGPPDAGTAAPADARCRASRTTRTYSTYVGDARPSVLAGGSWILVDEAIAAALSQLGPAANEARFGFVPPPEDESAPRAGSGATTVASNRAR